MINLIKMEKVINAFVDLIITHKKLDFFDYESSYDKILFDNNILKLVDNRVSIIDFKIISDYFVIRYKQILSFKLNKSFTRNVDFIKSIKDDFTKNIFVQDYHLLEKEIWKSVIKESNSQYKSSYQDYLREDNPHGIFKFIDAYAILLPELNLSVNQVFENAIIQAKISKSDAHYNIPLNNVLQGIKNVCTANYERGVQLLEKALLLVDNDVNILSAIVSGLYENKSVEFYHAILQKLINDERNVNEIFFGLATVSKIEKYDCQIFIKLIKKYFDNENYSISTLSIIFSILKSDNAQHYNFCFNKLYQSIENEKTANYILNDICFLSGYDHEKTDLLINLITQPYFTINKYITPISQVFWDIKDFSAFKNVVFNLIENHPFEKFIKAFQHYLYSVDKIELESFMIELLIDNLASKRYTGIEIFEEFAHNKPYGFISNILDLSPLSQYRLWVSLTEDFNHPNDRLISLLPLLKSSSEIVRECFICKLEVISEDYGGLVIQVLKNNLDEAMDENELIINRVQNYIDSYFSKNVDIKNSILEFNPYHTHYKYINKFKTLFSKKMSNDIEKGTKEHGLLSVLGANTIHLAKGGGWRFGKNKEIAQLGKFGSSFSLPRSYFLDPNKFDLEKGIATRLDWNDEDFSIIEQLMNDE